MLILSGEDTSLVNALQRRAAVVLQKSLREGFGLTVTEAMWKGTPVIGGNVGGIRYQIDDGVNGFLVSSIEETADRHRAAARATNELRRRMGDAAREKVRQHFLMTRYLEQYLDLFDGFETPLPLAARGAGHVDAGRRGRAGKAHAALTAGHGPGLQLSKHRSSAATTSPRRDPSYGHHYPDRLLAGSRQLDGEGGALSRLTLDGDVRPRAPPRSDGQSRARAPVLRSAGVHRALQPLEDPRVILRRDADAAIDDLKAHAVPSASSRTVMGLPAPNLIALESRLLTICSSRSRSHSPGIGPVHSSRSSERAFDAASAWCSDLLRHEPPGSRAARTAARACPG